jgi:decaprenylphospho-beta-D-erythro-pentofuranosid-2-ulose 2-reductase
VGKSVLVLGARSDIGRAIARRFAAEKCAIVLAARGSHELVPDKADIQVRHKTNVEIIDFDVADGGAKAFFDKLGDLPDIVVMVVGFLGNQAQDETALEGAARVMEANYSGPSLYLLEAARRMKTRGSGTIVGISSVAGERGRQSNYIYGSAKAGFTAFLSGLRNQLNRYDVHVVTVKPGFVATRMTAGMSLPPLLTATASEVADAVCTAVTRKRDVVYVRPVWRLIMLVIRSIPERIFKRLSL